MPKRILAFDDEQDILECIQFILCNEGYTVASSLSPENVFFQIGQFCPDLILMDIRMNEFDGLEICKAIRSNPETATIPVIIVSSDDRVRLAVKDYGASDAIAKPFNLDDLVEKVSEQLAPKVIVLPRRE